MIDFGVKLILILKIVRARVQGAVAVSSGWLRRYGALTRWIFKGLELEYILNVLKTYRYILSKKILPRKHGPCRVTCAANFWWGLVTPRLHSHGLDHTLIWLITSSAFSLLSLSNSPLLVLYSAA